MTGVVFYRGVSKLDGKPIIGIATFGSKNKKTGNLVQTWILRSDVHPVDAINSGEDASICGDCPLRGRIADISERLKESKFTGTTTNKERSCYVLVHQAPDSVYKAYHRGAYPDLAPAHAKKLAGKGLRYGSYGDPTAIPLEAWDELSKYCTGKVRAGYTHQWNKFPEWSSRVMASTHSTGENERASKLGWRTFRTIMDVTEKSGEIICPSSPEGGNRATCEECGACNGRREGDKRKSITIVAHGSAKAMNVGKVISRLSLPVV